ncbi:RNA polymerase sigma-70 factor (ECF subfamily) [Dysgonomonadaceae bacterium PH5-43]|nr:RNA polymerase sigma-70 factor (ECF subfamily) [Dysgonomonadaceae bacterium PH5-43]
MNLEQFKADILPLRQTLFFVALKFVQNKEDAEDIVQEVLLKLWTIRSQFNKISNKEGYAVRITQNICIDRQRIKKDTVEVEDCFLELNQNTPYKKTETDNAVDIIRKIIDSLPGLQKQIITMRDVDGYELEEIATITGTQVSAVTMNLSRARKKVRDLFKQINEYKAKYESE